MLWRKTSSDKFTELPSKASRWLMLVGVLSVAVIGIGLLVLMTQATGNRARYNANYEWLVITNAVVASGLLITILWGMVRLLLSLRKGQFGSRLLVKLAGIFGLVGVVPGLMIYVVSYQFVSRSIESWFDVKVEAALVAGLNLGRATLDTLSEDLAKQAQAAAANYSESSEINPGLAAEKIKNQLGATDVAIWTHSGQMVATSGASRFQLRSEQPSVQQLRQARQTGRLVWIEGLDEALAADKSRIKVLVPFPQWSLSLNEERRVLQVIQDLSPALVSNALEVQTAYSDYQERALAREGLRRMYIGTLTLSLFLAVLGAILLAVLLGQQLARPLLLLAHGMRQVAGGDLRPKLALQGKDELGGLTRSFADMTQQLADARATVERSLNQLDQARSKLQTILDNLTAGVMVLDEQGVIQSANPGATRILRVAVLAQPGMGLQNLPGLQTFAQEVQAHFMALARSGDETRELGHWQKSFDIHTAGLGLSQTGVTLLARGAVLPDGMRLLVFDDISDIVSAERAQAWGEVARRLAHEIKNPLTPIQLSAERLQRRLLGKLEPLDEVVLNKSVRTIVDQVDAMKRLVNEFRDYARLPSAELKPLQLNDLISDVMALYATEPLDRQHRAPVSTELDAQCPAILGDEQQLRQVIHNLLQNAQDACEVRGKDLTHASVKVRTEWRSARQRVRLVVTDTGPGFAPHILQRAFEPYVTTKSKGTGLGLAVVKKIADEHGARIDMGNRQESGNITGAQVSLSFAVAPPPKPVQLPQGVQSVQRPQQPHS